MAQTDGKARLDDIDLRIVRQRRRIEKIIIERVGPREEMEALLDDMIKDRAALLSNLEKV
jgi:hypothetical protein